MTLQRRAVERALRNKGFRREDRHHRFFIYYTAAGEKTPVRTKTSHGRGGNDIKDDVVSRMAQQCRITNQQFRQLVDCSLSQDDYEQELTDLGVLEH